jgi:hypothetical protein
LRADSSIVPSEVGGAGSSTVEFTVAAAAAFRNSKIVLVAVDPGPVSRSEVTVEQRPAGGAPLVPSFVMREGGRVTTVCQMRLDLPCTFDASASTSASPIIDYDWSLRFNTKGMNATLLLCNSQQTFEATLTVRNLVGETRSVTRVLAIVTAIPGCGT